MATIELRDLNPAEFNNNLIVYGRLGVGTASPSNALHVYGDGANGEIKVERSSGAVSLIQTQASLVRFGATSNHNLQLISNDDTKVTITTAGRLGIGTTSPSTELHVIGDTTVNNTSSNAVINLTSDSNSSILNFTNSNEGAVLRSDTYIRIDTNGSNERIRVLSDGKVGIGTTSPDVKLHLYDSTINSLDLLHLETAADSVDDYIGIKFTSGVGGSGPHAAIRVYGGPASGDSYMSLLTTSDGGTLTQGLTLLHNGNVGIGTTSPASTVNLHISDANPKLRLQDSDETNVYTEIFNSSGDTHIRSRDGSSNGIFSLIGNNGTTDQYFLRIDADGDVGIGTDSPTANLHIVDSSDPVLKIQNTSANPANAGTIHFIESGGTDGFKIHHDGNENRLEFQFESSSSETTFMTLKRDTGNVGINETNPTEKLHVNGNLKVTGSVKIGSGSQATSISEPGPFDAYTLYHWESKLFRTGAPAYYDTPLCYADADSPWNKSSVATASPISLMSTHGSASINTTSHGKRNYNWDYMIAFNGLDIYHASTSEAPSNYVAIKMPCYYTSGSSDHHVFHLRLRYDTQSGVMLWVCDSSKAPQKKAHGNFNSKRGRNARGSLVGPRNTVSSFNYHGHDWVPFTIRGDYIDTYSFADSDSPTGRSIYFAVTNAVTSGSNGANGQWIAGMAMSRNKKGCMITSGNAMYHAVNGSQGRGGNSVLYHGSWFSSDFLQIHHDRVGNCPVPIIGTDKDIIMTFISTGHPDHWGEGTDIYLIDGSGNTRYAGANGNSGWDSYVPNQVYRPGLSPIGSFQSLGNRAGFGHFGMIPYTIIIPQTEVARCAYDTQGILCLQIGFSKMHDPWRDGDYRAIATEPAI
jgi:hypothetical protein